MVDESMPPERKAPSGTSATICSSIASPSTASRASVARPRSAAGNASAPSQVTRCFARYVPCRPVGLLHRRFVPGAETQHRSRLDLECLTIDRVRRRYICVTHVERQGVAVDLRLPGRIGVQGLEFRGEAQASADMAVVERLLADAIARELQDPRRAIPHGKREHADRTPQRFDQPPVRSAASSTSVSEWPRQRAAAASRDSPSAASISARSATVVVDLAVERNDIAAAGRCHRLVPCRGEVEDRQSPMREENASFLVRPDTFVIRPAADDRICHPACHRLAIDRWCPRFPRVRTWQDQRRPAAHTVIFVTPVGRGYRSRCSNPLWTNRRRNAKPKLHIIASTLARK